MIQNIHVKPHSVSKVKVSKPHAAHPAYAGGQAGTDHVAVEFGI